jgi:hypothetical protein
MKEAFYCSIQSQRKPKTGHDKSVRDYNYPCLISRWLDFLSSFWQGQSVKNVSIYIYIYIYTLFNNKQYTCKVIILGTNISN